MENAETNSSCKKPITRASDWVANQSSMNASATVGQLGIIAMAGCEDLMAKIDRYILEWRAETEEVKSGERTTFQVKAACPRFGSGEGKGLLHESVRGDDLFILSDCFNYGTTYNMYGMDVPMSPDDHFQDVKRIISAISGKARRLTVIMPMLYEGRQHRRTSRESLDCAVALQELSRMGVCNIITFDAHDPRVQNAIPWLSLEDIHPTYQMTKALVKNVQNLDWDNMLIISPDEGGMSRCIYYSTVLGLDLGMFYKRRDYSNIVDGRNKIISHEFLGSDLSGRDVIVVDDMISSGDSIIDVARQLKKMGARRVFVFATFGLFCKGLEEFDKAYSEHQFEKVFTTNVVYRPPELASREWYCEVDLSKYMAFIINTLNHDCSISSLLDPADRIDLLLRRVGIKSSKDPHEQLSIDLHE